MGFPDRGDAVGFPLASHGLFMGMPWNMGRSDAMEFSWASYGTGVF